MDEATVVRFDDLITAPGTYVGELIEVSGTAFFLAECPPPGTSPTGCELAGYLAPPGTTSFTASDAAKAMALAESGDRLGCPEGTDPSPACGDWENAVEYTVVGVVERQVLGGRESELHQLDVISKSLSGTP